MKVLKIRYVCGHEVDFESNADLEDANSRRENRLAQEQVKCPACRHDSVRIQLISAKRLRKWK